MAIGMFCFLFAVLNEYIHLPSNEDLIEDSIKRSRARKLSLLRFISYYRQALLMISVSTLAMCYTMIYFSNPAPFILDFTFGFLVVAVVGFLASMSSPAAPLSNLGKYVLAMVFGFGNIKPAYALIIHIDRNSSLLAIREQQCNEDSRVQDESSQ